MSRLYEGFILNDLHILTTATACFDPDRPKMRLDTVNMRVVHSVVNIGTNPPNALAVSRIYVHDDYNHDSGKFNVGVLRVSENLNTGNFQESS